MKSYLKDRGLVHVYYGDGKGKTTAALGLALRMLGNGEQVVILQFLKNSPCGEIDFLTKQEKVTILRGKSGNKFTFAMSDKEKQETKEIHNQGMVTAKEIIKNWSSGLLVLDEGIDAYSGNMLDRELFKDLVLHHPPQVEVVITGHSLPDFFREHGDYITYMKKINHPFDKGLAARKGIEF